MLNKDIIRRKRELLRLRKIACYYLDEYKKFYYDNVANISEMIDLEKPEFIPLDGENRYLKKYSNLIIYENGYFSFQSGSAVVNYIGFTSYQKKK